MESRPLLPHRTNWIGTGTIPLRTYKKKSVSELERTLRLAELDLHLLPGADVRIEPDLADKIQDDLVLTLGDHRKHVLLELPHEIYIPLGFVDTKFRPSWRFVDFISS